MCNLYSLLLFLPADLLLSFGFNYTNCTFFYSSVFFCVLFICGASTFFAASAAFLTASAASAVFCCTSAFKLIISFCCASTFSAVSFFCCSNNSTFAVNFAISLSCFLNASESSYLAVNAASFSALF